MIKTTAGSVGRRQFVIGVGSASVGAIVSPAAAAEVVQAPASAGVLLHANEGQRVPPTPDGRVVTVKVDSALTPGVQMSMITEDLPPNSAIRVHLHEHEDETIFIRMGTGVATLGNREVPVGPGATIYVPQGVWHGLRNTGIDTLGMSAIYAPPGFEQSFKARIARPNRTPAETERTGRSLASCIGNRDLLVAHDAHGYSLVDSVQPPTLRRAAGQRHRPRSGRIRPR